MMEARGNGSSGKANRNPRLCDLIEAIVESPTRIAVTAKAVKAPTLGMSREANTPRKLAPLQKEAVTSEECIAIVITFSKVPIGLAIPARSANTR